ncbi:MAG: GTP cyclohydrolase FolE2 [bacterium]
MRVVQTDEASETLADVQALPDDRSLVIDWVGVKGLSYPITVLDRDSGTQRTVGSVTMLVRLPATQKGTHMSRFVEILEKYHNEITLRSVQAMLREMQDRLDSERARVEVSFKYFINKHAPVTGARGRVGYDCTLMGRTGVPDRMHLEVRVPVTTLCPCSKEISQGGAHNQRGAVTVKVRLRGMLWLEELVEMVERCASCEVYSVLKRPDEKFVTERAYEHPVFVEDLLREIAAELMRREVVELFTVEAETLESIHDHNAYGTLSRVRDPDAETGWR